MRKGLVGVATLIATVVLIMSTVYSLREKEPFYVTWESSALDAQSSLWLVQRFIAAGTSVDILPQGSVVRDGVSFGFDGADHARSGEHSTFATLVTDYAITDPVVLRLANIVDRIEISPWRRLPDENVAIVEMTYRELQKTVSSAKRSACYSQFFDRLYEQMTTNLKLSIDDVVAIADKRCDDAIAHNRQSNPVEYAMPYILQQLAAEKNVVFIDVREKQEYEEAHIPGARNIRLRDIDENVIRNLTDSDLVIPYCVKDFRGFEVAKTLLDAGISNVGIMSPHGFAGWRSLGLPVSSGDGDQDAESYQRLLACVTGVSVCQ